VIDEIGEYLEGKGENVSMALDSAVYLVMSHYGISIREVNQLSPPEFDQMFTWAAAAKKKEAEQAADGQRKGQKIESTNYSQRMPFSDGEW
tara:strand:- start:314 stop:586 length:273 start_codon:yes stop_codon:yes gene_type:complete